MRRVAILLAVSAALSSGIWTLGGIDGTAFAAKKIRLAQVGQTPITPQTSTVTSAVTNCMMLCNSTAASCQTTCVIPNSATVPISSGTASCQFACTNAQLSCQNICAQNSPSR